MGAKYKIWSPMKIGHKIARNRIVMGAMESRLNTFDGSPTPLMCDYYGARAKGGSGIIIVENTSVDNKMARSALNCSTFFSDHQISQKALLAQAITDHGAIAILQLSHAGRQSKKGVHEFQPVSASDITCQVNQQKPRPLEVCEIHEIQQSYVDAAVRAQKAGFDGVEMHAAHGYLILQFLSRYTNKRTDEYGGSLENRARFLKEILEKTRAAVGRNFIIGCRITVDEFVGPEGFQPEEAYEVAKMIEPSLDYISASAGNHETSPFSQNRSCYLPALEIIQYATEMKKHVNIPVFGVGGGFDARTAEAALQADQADFVIFGRQHVCDPDFANKILEDRIDDIRPCCRCNEGCLNGLAKGFPIRCEFNPSAGQEVKYKMYKVRNPKRVVVVGGGCAGLEAARVADLMGHTVTLMEKSSRFGGHAVEASLPPFKAKTQAFLDWQQAQVAKGRTWIQMGEAATPEMVLAAKPDAVIVAVGSNYTQPPFPGKEKAMFADEALFHPERVGKNVVVIGGGLVGVETALTLRENLGCNVTVVEMMPAVCTNMDGNARRGLLKRVDEHGLTVLTSYKVQEIKDDGILAADCDGKVHEIKADTVVMAVGLTANKAEADKFADLGVKTYFIGDCNGRARSIFYCTHEAWRSVFQFSEIDG
ncbi:FAD-dependent oxidoreductase [Desulfovibrio sp. OttesenSCG-928-C06]|nr:FAD-dependent oxidoreductase [Desulfovibrio sp. OttesenSCG-928-C06]